VIGNRQFDYPPPYSADFFVFRDYHHALLNWSSTGCWQSTHSVDFNNTQTAGPVWLQVWIIAQGWDIDSCFPGGFQHGRTGRNLYLMSING